MPNVPPNDFAHRVAALCGQHLRAPRGYATDEATGQPVLVFEPPLTTAEQATLVIIQAIARSGLDLSPAEYGPVRTELAALRDLRQLGRNAFLALTAAERDRRLYDAQTSTTIILLAILRD